jgi:hypothetical protein
MAEAHGRRLSRSPQDQSAFEEWLHWLAPTWGHEFFRGYLIDESGLKDDQVENLLSLLSIDFRNGSPKTSHARDGYFPPVWQLPGSLLLSTEPTLMFTHLRNVLYSIQRTAPQRFDNVVSQYLEPALLKAASSILARCVNFDIRSNIEWRDGSQHGEIDLLIFHAEENAALHIQAKAPLPPQGARLVERLEQRLIEGFQQLERFRSLPCPTRDRIISQALGEEVKEVRILDAVLARSCFGTHSLRTLAGDVELLSLPILAGAAGEYSSSSKGGIIRLLNTCSALKERLWLDAQPTWKQETISLDHARITLPLLNFDEDVVARLRALFWRDFSSLGRAS